MKSTLVVLFGPPAVGKMTVGRALEARTGLPLFHNHMTIELVVPFFEFGSPPYGRLVGHFRRRLMEEVADSDLPGLIFTYVWALDLEGDNRFIEEIADLFAARGGRIVFAELWADQATRLLRNEMSDRLEVKPTKRDLARSRAGLLKADAQYRLNTDGGLEGPFADFPYVWIDTLEATPDEAAARLVETFDLPGAATVAGRGARG